MNSASNPIPDQVPAPVALLFGAPGSGKGTHADKLCRQFHLVHISTGDIFRVHLNNNTELGRLARGYLDCGELVPDEVTIAMLGEQLLELEPDDAVILDGFPRTLAQAEALDRLLQRLGRRLTAVIYLNVDDEEIVSRLADRLICHSCHRPANRAFRPPRVEGVCDTCGGELRQRPDDNPEAVKTRLKTYHAQTKPLIDYYQQRRILHEIRGEIGPEAVNASAQAVLSHHFTRIPQLAAPKQAGR
jgi:adenylate kinase